MGWNGCIYHYQDLDYHLILKHVASDFSRARRECVIEKKKRKENLGILFRALYNKCLVKSLEFSVPKSKATEI